MQPVEPTGPYKLRKIESQPVTGYGMKDASLERFKFMEGMTMLVLSRKVGEAIYIDGHVKIEIVQVSGRRVKVGIEAPDEVRILRSELTERSEFSSDGRLHSKSRNGSNVLRAVPK